MKYDIIRYHIISYHTIHGIIFHKIVGCSLLGAPQERGHSQKSYIFTAPIIITWSKPRNFNYSDALHTPKRPSPVNKVFAVASYISPMHNFYHIAPNLKYDSHCNIIR